MQNTQENCSMSDTPKSPLRIDITKEDNGWTSVRVSRPTSAQGTPPPFPPTSPDYCPMRSPPPSQVRKCVGRRAPKTHAKHTKRTRKVPTFRNPNDEASRMLVPPNGNKLVKYNHQRQDPRGSIKNHPRDQGQPAGSIKRKKNNMDEPTGRSVIETDAGNTKRRKRKIATTPEDRYPGKRKREDGERTQGHVLGERGAKKPSRISKSTKGKSKNCWKNGTETKKRLPTLRQKSETREGRSWVRHLC